MSGITIWIGQLDCDICSYVVKRRVLFFFIFNIYIYIYIYVCVCVCVCVCVHVKIYYIKF